MSETNGNRTKRVFVTGYPNIAPANTAITKQGEGSNVPIAIGRAIHKIFEDDRVKHKKIVLPMRLVVTGE